MYFYEHTESDLNMNKPATLKLCQSLPIRKDQLHDCVSMSYVIAIGKVKIEFCMACSREHSASDFDTKIRCLAQFLTELLRILSFKT